MPKYRPYAPATPTRPRTTPHRSHVTWDLSCDRCVAQMAERSARMVAQRAQATARTMRTAPGFSR
jgi:hypothetical protein